MRINLFGGPNTGKSTTALKICSALKENGTNVEYTMEYIKTWAYMKIIPKSFDQYYIFAKQLHSEDVFLSNGVEHIVTDSPLFMQLCYMKKYNTNYFPLLSIVEEFENRYPSINVFLDREGIPFKAVGRYESKVEQAIEVDNLIMDMMDQHNIPYTKIKTLDFNSIMSFVDSELKNLA